MFRQNQYSPITWPDADSFKDSERLCCPDHWAVTVENEGGAERHQAMTKMWVWKGVSVHVSLGWAGSLAWQ